jgi:plastocyanin
MTRRTRGRALLAGAVVLVAAVDAPPDGLVIHQQGRRFSETAVTVQRGQPITFLNDDSVPHNVMSDSAENGFDVGSQLPGSVRVVRFDIAGTVVVICAIHPRMRMVVTVAQ